MSASASVSDRSAPLTLVLPEDPRAHKLEEAAGVEPRPVHGDGVLRTGSRQVRARRAFREGRRVGNSTYAVVDQGLPGVLQLLHEPGGAEQEAALSRISFCARSNTVIQG